MLVALTRPNYDTHLITPPLGLGYLSSYLKKHGHETKIIDGLNLSLNNDEIVERCKKADLVGIAALSDYFNEVIDLSHRLKKIGKKVVIGFAMASSEPELTLQETKADYVVISEGEITMFELVEAIENGNRVENIHGLYIGKDKAFIHRKFIDNLDSLPFPDWEQLDPRKYKKAPHGGLVKAFPVAPMTTTRGCPFECTFCASPKIWDKKIRYRSPNNVTDEIEFLAKEFQVKEIHFEDDNLTLKREHIEGICYSILERGLKIFWALPNGIRVDTVTPSLLRLMKESGCYSIAYGIESGSQEILKNIKKKTKIETIEYAVNEAYKAGIITQGFFIFGLPGETSETIKATMDFANRIKLDKAQFLLLDILPGTGLADQLQGKFKYNWNNKSYQEVTWVPDTVSEEELSKAPSVAFKKFFFRPRQMFYILKFFKFEQVSFILRRILDFNILNFDVLRKINKVFRKN